MNFKPQKILQALFSILFWVAIWAIIAYKIGITFLLPSPKETLDALIELISTSDFWSISLHSIVRIFYGIVIAILFGILLAVFTTQFSIIDTLMAPVMSAVKATPIASFIILAFYWFDKSQLPVFITILIVLPIVLTNIGTGIRTVNKELTEVSNVYGLGLLKRLTKLYIPSIMPYFLSACRSALGMAWKAGIAAEVICCPKYAIGTELQNAKTYMKMPEMFAWTVTVIIFSLIIEKIFIYLITKLSARLHTSSEEVKL